jgi:hypothetical protein
MITLREPEIRAALLEHPELDDRAIGKLLDIRLWSKVRLVRKAMATEATAAAAGPVEQADLVARTCATCGFVSRTPGGLAIHQTRRHRAAPVRPALVEPRPDLNPPPPALVLRPTIQCANCGREGSASTGRPDWCVACAASSELAAARAAWNEKDWRCECARAFARSTHDPARCIKCTGEYDKAARRHRTGLLYATAD